MSYPPVVNSDVCAYMGLRNQWPIPPACDRAVDCLLAPVMARVLGPLDAARWNDQASEVFRGLWDSALSDGGSHGYRAVLYCVGVPPPAMEMLARNYARTLERLGPEGMAKDCATYGWWLFDLVENVLPRLQAVDEPGELPHELPHVPEPADVNWEVRLLKQRVEGLEERCDLLMGMVGSLVEMLPGPDPEPERRLWRVWVRRSMRKAGRR